uniref:Uncharacterized protein n=1 Tax=Plectus sambesii TaxID=2011161 RepID=A0A914X7R2_9BILA
MKSSTGLFCLLFVFCTTAIFAQDEGDWPATNETDIESLRFGESPAFDEHFDTVEGESENEIEEGSVPVEIAETNSTIVPVEITETNSTSVPSPAAPVAAFDDAEVPNAVKEELAEGRRSPTATQKKIRFKKRICKKSHYSSDNVKQVRLRKRAGCDDEKKKG